MLKYSSLFCLCIGLIASNMSVEARGLKLGSLIKGGVRGGVAFEKQYGNDVLSVSQLKTCLSVQESSSALEKEKLLFQMKSKLNNITVNRYDGEAVERYNAQVASYKEYMANFNTAIDLYNQKVEKARDLASSFNITCTQKKYYEDDFILAQQEVNVEKTSGLIPINSGELHSSGRIESCHEWLTRKSTNYNFSQ